MKKTIYRKPVVMDLEGGAVSGQDVPQACIAGAAVPFMGCLTGGNDTLCSAGTDGILYPEDCISGLSATASYTCISGGTAGYECGAGGSPTHPGSCTTGPSYVG